MDDILAQLGGGDRRSIGRANEVVEQVLADTSLFERVFRGMSHDDPVMRMRASDVVEKVTRARPDLLAGYSDRVVTLLENTEQQEVCWHLAQIAPRLVCQPEERSRLVSLLKSLLAHKSRIVQVSALDALASFAMESPALTKDVIRLIKGQMANGAPSVVARGRKLLSQLTPE